MSGTPFLSEGKKCGRMKQDLQEEEMKAMVEAPVSGKRVGIVRLQMVREGRTLYGMGVFDKPL